MKPTSPRETLLVVITIARLGLGVGFCESLLRERSPYISIAWLFIIIVADIADGILARRWGVDTTLRRIVDTVVDRITIHVAIALVWWLIPQTVAFLLAVFIRDVVLIARAVWLYYRRRVMITPANAHRFGTLLYGVLCATLLIGTGQVAVWTAVVVSIVVWLLLADYWRGSTQVPRHPRDAGVIRYQAVFRGKPMPLLSG